MGEKNEDNKNVKKEKVLFPISFKLITIFSILTIAVLALTTFMVSTLVRSDEQLKAVENNHTINGRTAQTIQQTILNKQSDATGFISMIDLISDDSQQAEKIKTAFNDFCTRNPETVFIYFEELGTKVSPEISKMYKEADKKAQEWIEQNARLSDKKAKILNASSIFNRPVLAIVFPCVYGTKTTTACIAFLSDSLAELMSTGSLNTTFLVNKDGQVLVHPDTDKILSSENLKYLPAVEKMISSKNENEQNVFPDEEGNLLFYAYHRIIGDMFVVTTISHHDVFEAINRTTYRIVLFSIAVIFLAIIIIRFFSKTLTSPIGKLVDASHDIEEGNFSLELKSKTRDEIGVLTSSFNHMAKGLGEREILMKTFSKFTNKTLAQKAINGELKLGGETKKATIFFSDIRSFTAMSEKLTPQEVVEFLNEYMTRMVECVNKTNGIVDKFIGDAIMAVWGTPESSGSAADDAWNAVKAALMMRVALSNYNKERVAAGKAPMRIGCGINTGDVVAGQIGSSERMEYTVIGDAVNFASRTEALNKPFATDILITENTYDLVKDKVVVEEMPSVHVKGKEGNVKMFAVVCAAGAKGIQTIQQLRAFLGVEAPDLAKVDTNEEEKKYSINS